MGIEPTAQAWEAWVLPLYDARLTEEFNWVAPSGQVDAVQRNTRLFGVGIPDLN